MRVLIDANPLLTKRKRGIGVYIYYLISSLLKIKSKDEEINFVLEIDKFIYPWRFKRLPRYIPIKIAPFIAYKKFNLFHSTQWFLPKKVKKWILTLHDLYPVREDIHNKLKYPERAHKRMKNYRKKIRNLIKKKPCAIIVPSKTIKEEFKRIFPDYNSENVFPIYHGITLEEVEKEKPCKALPAEKYILTVGSGDRRKNIKNAQEAMRILYKKGIKIPWVIVGNKISSEFSENIYFFNNISDAQIKFLYKNALLLFFPSVYEGFGMPLLEAMSEGIPVCASDIPVFNEIAKDAFVPFDPIQPESIALALEKTIKNPKLQNELAQKGKELSKNFSWLKTADETLKVYRRINKVASLNL